MAAPSVVFGQQPSHSVQKGTTAELRVSGDVATPLTWSPDELKKMPRKTLKVLNPREQKTEAYEGVPFEALLRRAGVPQGSNMRGAAMATYVVAETADG